MSQSDLDKILEVWPDRDEPVAEEVKPEEEKKEETTETTEEEPTKEVEEGKETTDETAVEKTEEEPAAEKTETEEKPKEEETKPETFVPEGELYDLLKEEGKEFKTIEEFNSHVTETVKNLKQQASEFAAVSQKLGDLIQQNPEYAILTKALGEGKDFLEAIVEAGIPNLIPEPGDFDHEEFQKKVAERKEANKVSLRTQEELQANITKSKTNLDKFVKDNKLGDDYTNTVYKTVSEFANGNVSNDIMSLIHKGLQYDQEVKRLTELAISEKNAGLVQGRNEKIVKEKQMKSKDVDVPDITSKNKTKEGASILTDEEKLMLEINNRNTHFQRR